jgi:group I intron endonuclease
MQWHEVQRWAETALNSAREKNDGDLDVVQTAMARIKQSGIYVIKNVMTQQEYVGSSKNIHRRLTAHLSDLRLGKHHSGRMQASWNKYGPSVFQIAIAEEVGEISALTDAEQKWIDQLNPFFNIRRDAHAVYGSARKEETREKHRLNQLGKKHSDETRQQMSLAHTGKKMSDETKKKMSLAKTGVKQSPEAVEKRKLTNSGYRHSDEVRLKMSINRRAREALKGNQNAMA